MPSKHTISKATNETGKEIGTEGACALSEALKVNKTLTKLNLGCEHEQQDTSSKSRESVPAKTANKIGVYGASALAGVVKVNKTLIELNLESPATENKAMPNMNTAQTITNETDNGIGAEGTRALSEALKVNSKLAIVTMWCE